MAPLAKITLLAVATTCAAAWYNISYFSGADTAGLNEVPATTPTVPKSPSSAALESMAFLRQFAENSIEKKKPKEFWEITLPNKNSRVNVCICAKCGSTSFYLTLYEMTHGKKWSYKGTPWIHELSSHKRWTDIEVKKVDGLAKQGQSIVLIRDPKERIISAWKSKVMCSKGRDYDDFVPPMLELAGMPKDSARKGDNGLLCLELSQFLQVLYLIHANNKQGMLNGHFLPQHLGCFRQSPPQNWTIVTTIKSPHLGCQMSDLFQDDVQKNCTVAKTHSTEPLSKYANLTEMDEALLDAITQEEYKALGEYL